MSNDHDDADDDDTLVPATPERLAEIRHWYDWSRNVGAADMDKVGDLLDHIDWLEAELARLADGDGP